MIRTLQDALSCKHLQVELTSECKFERDVRLACTHPCHEGTLTRTYTSSDVCRICKHHEFALD